jgi:transcriptional regulator with XRE-family HTH domain
MNVGNNLKILRKLKKESQEETATALGMTRSTYSGYENGVAQPNLDSVLALANYFDVSIDNLLKKNFESLSEKELAAVMAGPVIDLSGRHLRVLTSLVDSNDEELIEMVSQKASAGYVHGYADPEYLKVLPTFSLPFLSRNKKYRSFPIQGDSMPPVVEGSQVVGEFVQNWNTIRSGTPCVVVTQDDGIVFKVLNNHLANNQSFQLCSTNTFYSPYEVKANEIVEIWKFVNYISPELPEVQMDENTLTRTVRDLQSEIHSMKMALEPKN